ncbi:hypothetical protein [Neobacillus drentensis]|uniref:hypothetical protein n=1 Tax=Neobacillus drentensis TaxID=220684 RepID=UPI002FFDCEC0
MFLRKDATKHLVMRVDELIRKTTIYAKIAIINEKTGCKYLQASFSYRIGKYRWNSING